ncbi:hypothetical protein NP233_g9373 [Leucocoprinus birnbaumii]|uniref:Uncharacterized protein n=1 Tax=Leucocoprinus birnbaumii TaxID=56174 RepID=A0AAD5VL55_9AGAR|nr:hypothetical protein NP233_g9373 [Leucocoprinus birnbaumii]
MDTSNGAASGGGPLQPSSLTNSGIAYDTNGDIESLHVGIYGSQPMNPAILGLEGHSPMMPNVNQAHAATHYPVNSINQSQTTINYPMQPGMMNNHTLITPGNMATYHMTPHNTMHVSLQLTIEQLEKEQSELRAEIKGLKSSQLELREEMRSNNNGQAKKQSPPKMIVNPVLRSLTQTVMRDLLGINKARSGNDDENQPIPNPLGPGEESRQTLGGSKLWNPDWNQAVNVGINMLYISHVIQLAAPSCGVNADVINDSEIRYYAHQYFLTLRNTWKGQISEPIKEKQMKKRDRTRVNARKRTKSKHRRQAVGLLKAHGTTNLEGVEEVILTDWMSSEHSDCGNVSITEWKRHCSHQIGKVQGKSLEVCKLAWRADWLNHLYCHLDVLSSKLANDTKSAKTSGVRYTRFEGPPKNVNFDPPKAAGQDKLRPFQACISLEWAEKHNQGNKLLLRVNPPSFTVFNLEIPNKDLEYKGELEYDS